MLLCVGMIWYVFMYRYTVKAKDKAVIHHVESLQVLTATKYLTHKSKSYVFVAPSVISSFILFFELSCVDSSSACCCPILQLLKKIKGKRRIRLFFLLTNFHLQINLTRTLTSSLWLNFRDVLLLLRCGDTREVEKSLLCKHCERAGIWKDSQFLQFYLLYKSVYVCVCIENIM